MRATINTPGQRFQRFVAQGQEPEREPGQVAPTMPTLGRLVLLTLLAAFVGSAIFAFGGLCGFLAARHGPAFEITIPR